MRALVVVCLLGAVGCGSSSSVRPVEDTPPPPAAPPAPPAPPVPPAAAPSPHRLTVTIEGSGTVRSDPAGVDCPRSCTADFAPGIEVRLVATPDPDWALDALGGACTAAPCAVTLAADTSVFARFRPRAVSLTVAFAGKGTGKVVSTPAGIDCPGRCSATFAAGTEVQLSAVAGLLSAFAGWSGPCAGRACDFAIHADAAAIASFSLRRYRVTLLAGPDSIAWNISPHSGLVTGTWLSGQAFVWNGAVNEVPGARSDLMAINDAGTVAGVRDFRAMRWSQGVATDLGTLGGQMAMAEAINARGVVAGWAELADQRVHAAAWTDGLAIDLGAIDPACDLSQAWGINSAGTIVGEVCVGGRLHPARFRGPGLIDDLGSWGGNYAHAAGINDKGTIVGNATRAGESTQRAFVWTEATGLRDVGALPGLANSYLASINSAGLAAGGAFDLNNGGRRGIVWGEDRLLDLNDLVEPGPWFIDSAGGVDESGRITAIAVVGGRDRAALLTPE